MLPNIPGGELIMRHSISFDSHTHSNNSFDAENSAAQMLEQANKLGLDCLTITDHFESAFYYRPNEEFGDLRKLLPQSVADIKKAQELCGGKTELLCGIELGEPLHDLNATEEVLKLADYDFILCSLHNLKDMGDFFWLDYQKEDIPKLLKKYFLELIECVQWGGFNSLAHITYPFRYICGKFNLPFEPDEYKQEIDELLSLLAKNDKALEFNTCRNKDLSPLTINMCRDVYFLKRFKELGGKFVTLGSDAHKTQDLAKGIDGAMDILFELGYREAAVYKKGEPVLFPIK